MQVLYFQLILASVSLPVKAEIVCPSKMDYSPCNCLDSGDETIVINCGSTKINEERVSQVLESFLQPEISPVSAIQLCCNGLANVPPEIARFPQLQSLNLDQNEAIGTIPSDAFPDSLTFLDSYFNGVTQVEPGALKGSCNLH